jgi:hypothetical protein
MCEIYWKERMPHKVAHGEWRENIKQKSTEDSTFKPFRDYSGNWIVETQEITFIEVATNEERARLHRYITDKGTTGGSGHPDPKRIRLADGQKYNLTRPTRNEACAVCGQIGYEWPKDKPQFRDTTDS